MAYDVPDKLRRKARKRARREVRPYKRQARQDIQQIRSETRREKQSISGAANMAAQAIANTKLKGLKGPYRRDLAQEMARRAASVEASVPFLQSAVGAQAQQDIAAVRREVPSVGAATQTALADLVKLRNERRQEKAEKQRDSRVKTNLAYQEGLRLIKATPDLPHPSQLSDADWAGLEGQIARAEGIDLPAARRAVDQIRRRTAPIRTIAQETPPAVGTLVGQGIMDIARQVGR